MSQIGNVHDARAREILETTLRFLDGRRRRRAVRRRLGGVAALLALLWIGHSLVLSPRDHPEVTWYPILPEISFSSVEEPKGVLGASFGEPRTLLLVMDGSGVEIRAVGPYELSALARKPDMSV